MSGFLNGFKLWLYCGTLTVSNVFNFISIKWRVDEKLSRFHKVEGVINKFYRVQFGHLPSFTIRHIGVVDT